MHENDVIRHDCQFKYVKNNQHIWYDCYRAKDRGENLIVLSEDGKDLLGCNTTDGILIIPEGVETIKRDSLKESYPIRQIIIPKSLKFIDDFAFNGTDSILIPFYNLLYIHKMSILRSKMAFCIIRSLLNFSKFHF